MNVDSLLILALECSTNTVSAAVMHGNEVLAEVVDEAEQAHAERILPAIDRVLKQSATQLDALNGFAIADGPGGFTSLRIGISTLKGLAFGSECPIAAVPTLEALASLAEPKQGEWIVPMLDARRQEVYAAAFVQEGSVLKTVLPESVYSLEELTEALPAQCLLLGEGVEILGDSLRQALGKAVRLAPEVALRATAVGRLGLSVLARGEGRSAEELTPRYVRRAEAEVKRTGQRFES